MSIHPASRTHTVTEAVEDYVKAIHALQDDGCGRPVATSQLAARLDVTAASVSAMVKRLSELGLAEHAPYKGVTLTREGERLALEMLRHHRLLELYLAEHLDVPWDQVHHEADRLEHVLSEELEARIAAKLRHPTHDPHGDPIPTATLTVDEHPTISLAALPLGARGRLVRVSDRDPEMLRYLHQRGVAVGDTFEMIDRQPFGGPLTVRLGSQRHVLGPALASAMHAQLD